MLLTYLSKELHSFLNISALFRKLFTDTYPIQRFFKKMTFFSYIFIHKIFNIVDINKKLCNYLDTYTRKLQCKFCQDPSTGYKALGILMIKNLQYEKTAFKVFEDIFLIKLL